MGISSSRLKRTKRNKRSLSWNRFGSLISLRSKNRHSIGVQTLRNSAVETSNEISSTTPSVETVNVIGVQQPEAVDKKPKAETTRQRVAAANSNCKIETGRIQRKHLEVDYWLKALDLQQYREVFKNFYGVENLIDCSECDIRELGVKISSHRAAIMTSLTALRTKYYDNSLIVNKRMASIRHSVAVDSHKKIIHDDARSELNTVKDSTRSKSLNNFLMEPCADSTMDQLALKKALEWELSLDNRDLRSHAWYHGAIPRGRAEEIVRDEGCFLVRDCTSQPGNYVLTCRRNQQALHFVITRQILQPDTVYERVQYQFEDDPFDTVADLITSYVGSGRTITTLSGARISTPMNRMYPLSFYATKYPAPLCAGRLSSPATTPLGTIRYPMQAFKQASPTRCARDGAPRLPSKKQRSQSLTPAEVQRMAAEKCNSADGVIQPPMMTRSAGCDVGPLNARFSSQSLPRSACARLSISPGSVTLGRNSKINRVVDGGALSEDETLPDSPPPKPARIPYARNESKDSAYADGGDGKLSGGLQRVTSYHASGSDSGNGSGDSAVSSAAGDAVEASHRNSGVVIKNPRYCMQTSESTTTLKNFDFDYASAEEKLRRMEMPEVDCATRFDLDNFQTILLPMTENKPLDGQALKGIKLILRESGSRILANHLTRVDFDLIYGITDGKFCKLGSGLELCTLPHGQQLRLDLIERTECLKLLVALTILTCNDEGERAETLNKWIEVAIDTKTALGNLYGFCGIMLGLCLPQIERLDSTWYCLRQKYTDSAFNFEAKLRPMLKSMNNCSNPQAPNTTIPHLLPFILLMERSLEDFVNPINEQRSLAVNCLGLWEANTQDFGLSTLFAHMDAARKFTSGSATFQRNADIVLGDARMEELTTDMFRTEFHLKFLWGSRGAYALPYDRHSKFEQVLSVMAEKYCNNIKEESEV